MIEIKLDFTAEDTENIATGLGWGKDIPQVGEETGEETLVPNPASAEEFLEEKVITHIEQLLSRYELRKLEVEQRQEAQVKREQAQQKIRDSVTVTRLENTRK